MDIVHQVIKLPLNSVCQWLLCRDLLKVWTCARYDFLQTAHKHGRYTFYMIHNTQSSSPCVWSISLSPQSVNWSQASLKYEACLNTGVVRGGEKQRGVRLPWQLSKQSACQSYVLGYIHWMAESGLETMPQGTTSNHKSRKEWPAMWGVCNGCLIGWN